MGGGEIITTPGWAWTLPIKKLIINRVAQNGTKIEKLGQKNKVSRDHSIFDRFLQAKHTFKKFVNAMK